MVEIVGTLASIIILLSFIMEDEVKIRLINIVGCLVFVYYGIKINAFSIWFLNIMLIIVHLNKLLKLKYGKKKGKKKWKSLKN